MVDGYPDAAPAAVSPALEAFLARAVEGMPAARLRLITLPAPQAPLERLWEAWPEADAVLWDSPAGAAVAGAGGGLELAAAGCNRFAALEAKLVEATRELESVAWSGLEPEDAQFVGGLAFTPGGAASEPWSGLDDARFLLPRWSYRCDASGARLKLALPPGDDSEPEATAREYRHLCGVLAGDAQLGEIHEVVAVREEPPPEDWERAVERARTRIRAGELAKVVLARRLVVTTRRRMRPEALLTSLAAHERGQYRFGIRVAGRALVGASPELLVSRAGLAVDSEALAGSVARRSLGDDPGELLRRLTCDPKQMEEHRLVVEAIREALASVCVGLEYPPQPELRVLRHLAHLATPFAGQLGASISVLALAARLHPTPAVGGVPREAAQALITLLEDAPRGWFAGPVGVLAPSGDGELAVALRCAMVTGRHAHVYAGAGIVEGSEPRAEVEETAAKAAAALAALGLVT